MKFGDRPVTRSEGGLLAHSVKLPDRTLKKGHRLLADDITTLQSAGINTVVVAMLDVNDVHEDEAALQIAEQLKGQDPNLSLSAPFTGRCNLIASKTGVVTIDRSAIDALNAVDESVTVATLAPDAVVNERQMVATVKVIPFAVREQPLLQCCEIAARSEGVRLHEFRQQNVALIQTCLPQTRAGVLDKTERVTQTRLAPLHMRLTTAERSEHTVASLSAAIEQVFDNKVDLLLIAGASAIVDRRDVIPAAIEAAGGIVRHFGMPVDPGNLILLGDLKGKPVLGLPGCARSPKYNGLDIILERYAAGLTVTPGTIQAMGVGGLLKEIASRPQPRAGRETARDLGDGQVGKTAAIVLAAGRSRRMGKENKLLCPIDGKRMLERTLESVLASSVDMCVVVTGHDQEAIKACINDVSSRTSNANRVTTIHNADFTLGLSTSLNVGLTRIDKQYTSVLICLGDMPFVRANDIDRLIAAFSLADDRLICVPTWHGKRGNPVLWARQFVDAMTELRGDVGARHLIGDNEHVVQEVAMPNDAVLTDIDTPQALAHSQEKAAK